MQVPSPGQDTEASEVPVDPCGFGLGWIDQPVARPAAEAAPATSPDERSTIAMANPTLEQT
jgi:hypothetical protein